MLPAAQQALLPCFGLCEPVAAAVAATCVMLQARLLPSSSVRDALQLPTLAHD